MTTSSHHLKVIPQSAYAGDIPAPLAWQWVQSGEAVLVDVRTDAERAWVGQVPGASPVEWKQWPGMTDNPSFDAQLRAAVPEWCALCRRCHASGAAGY